jgi:pyridoxine 4-dehydrogenase
MSKVKKTFKIGGDLEINRLGYGAMRLTGKGIWGEPKDSAEAKRVLQRAVELGVNFIDTADSYGPDVSERLIGEALSPFPKGLIVATKAGLTRQGPDQWAPVGRAEYLTQQVEMSLRRLKTDVIDLWQLHRIDAKVPVEESLGAISKLQKAGKIRHVGLSEVKPKEIDQARKVIEIVSVQNLYNVGDRKHEDPFNIARSTAWPSFRGSPSQPENWLSRVENSTSWRSGTNPRSRSFRWPGSCIAVRSCCQFPEPHRSNIWKKI